MAAMDKFVRAKVNAILKERGMTRADLARAAKMHPNSVTRALNNTGNRGGNLPLVWVLIFDALNLRLTVEPVKQGNEKP